MSSPAELLKQVRSRDRNVKATAVEALLGAARGSEGGGSLPSSSGDRAFIFKLAHDPSFAAREPAAQLLAQLLAAALSGATLMTPMRQPTYYAATLIAWASRAARLPSWHLRCHSLSLCC
jgi:hypothetical protein